VTDEAKDFIKRILVLDPKHRLTIKEMLAHPFLNSEDIPKRIPVEALNGIPNFNNFKAPIKEECVSPTSHQKS
jgi:serine/threonine protein kinase